MDAVLHLLHDLNLRRILGSLSEALMLCQCQMAGVEDERIAGDAGAGMVGLRDTAIDDEELAVCLAELALFLQSMGNVGECSDYCI